MADFSSPAKQGDSLLENLRRKWPVYWMRHGWEWGWLGNGWNGLRLGKVTIWFKSGPSPRARLRRRLRRG